LEHLNLEERLGEIEERETGNKRNQKAEEQRDEG